MKRSKKGLFASAIVIVIILAIVIIPALTGAQNYGSVSLHTGFFPDPRMLGGTSGGETAATAFGSSCRGWVTTQPDHHMFLTTNFNFLRVFVRSQGDTTLAIRGPIPNTTVRCNDDRFGRNPAIDGSWAPGQYLIWVGSFNSREMHPYQIGFTELNNTQ